MSSGPGFAGSLTMWSMPPSDRDDPDLKVRRATLAGRWYPAPADELERELRLFYESVPERPPARCPPRAVVVPHAGYRFSGATAAHAYKALGGTGIVRVLLLGPAHHDAFAGLAPLDADVLETPLGRLPVDRAAVQKLLRSPPFVDRPQAHDREHALEIQLPFLQTSAARGASIVPIVVGRLDGRARRLAAARLREIAGTDTVVVVSSDFTHYGAAFDFAPFGMGPDVPARIADLDRGAIDFILRRDRCGFQDYRAETGATICGARPIELFLQMSESEDLEGELIAYTRSGDLTGDFEHCVSYAALLFRDAGRLASEDRHRLFALAWSALRDALGAGSQPPSTDHGPALDRVRGVFVTLRKHGELRGCVGQLEPTVPLHLAVREAAVSAACRDPRFPPLTAAEVPEVDMEISVLSELVRIEDPGEIVIGRDGLLVECGRRRGTLLPQVAVEHGLDADEFLDRTFEKAGLPADAIERETHVEIYRYEAQVLSPSESP
jgi:AmmeMemoRadiSam system protein B/AmmeMemoRadiSam system protein A